MTLDRNWGGEPGRGPRASKNFESKSCESLESYQRGFYFSERFAKWMHHESRTMMDAFDMTCTELLPLI